MIEELSCKVWNKVSDVVENAMIRIDFDRECELILTTASGVRWRAEASNQLAALNSIRAQMELKNLYPLCYGARLDVFASGMGRGARATRKVYRLEMGKQASRENLVDIFYPTNKENIASLEDQTVFYQSWADSLR